MNAVRLAAAVLCLPFVSLSHAATDLRFEGMTVIVHVPIEMAGVRRIVDGAGQTYEALPYIEREVEKIWNDALAGFSFACWTFRLDIELKQRGQRPTKGWHYVVIDPAHRTSEWDVTGPDDLIPDRDFPFAYTRDMTGTFNTPDPEVLAHEIGHALGLGDDYFTAGGYKPEAGGLSFDTGVVFLDQYGDPIPRGSFMTSGRGAPEPVHIARAVQMMREAGVLPPCKWTGTIEWAERAANNAEPNVTGDEIRHDGSVEVVIEAHNDGTLTGTIVGNQSREYWYGYAGGPFCTAAVPEVPVTATIGGTYAPAEMRIDVELTEVQAQMTQHLTGGDGKTLICDEEMPIDYYSMYLPSWFKMLRPADDWGFTAGWDYPDGRPAIRYSLVLKRAD